MRRLPVVALIGQTNAGKSSLLNRFAKKNIAIVAREEGTTRDNVMAKIGNEFLLIDTAGLKNPEDEFEASIQEQILEAVELADLILVTVDSVKYPDFRDKEIAKQALKSKKPVLLVLNKADVGGSLDRDEFLNLGIKADKIFRTSATTGEGVRKLREVILKTIAEEIKTDNQESKKENDARIKALQKQKSDLKIALIGRPNVGKSSLFNTLAKKQQAVVSSKQGTTRDINRVNIKYKGKNLEILDTAGLRRPGKREVGIEKFSAIRSLTAIEEADICALLVDGTEPHAKLDQALAGQIIKAGKGIIVVITKTDLLQDEKSSPSKDNEKSEEDTSESNQSKTDKILDQLEEDFNFMPYAPVLITSSKTGKNVTELFELALMIDKNRHFEIKTADLNCILEEAVLAHPPAGLKNTRPRPKYMVQTDSCPPWFVIHGHDLSLMHWSYKRFLERKIREFYPYVGTPIEISVHNGK